MADSVVDITIKASNEAGAVFKQLLKDLAEVKAALRTVGDVPASAGVTASLEDISGAAQSAIKSITAVSTALTGAAAPTGDMAGASEELATGLTATATAAASVENSVTPAADSLGELGQAANDAVVPMQGLPKATDEASNAMGRMGEEVEALSESLPKMVRFLKLALGGFLAFQSVRFGKGLADDAARTEVLGTVLRTVGANAGIGSAAIETMDKAVQKLGITAEASRDALTKLIQSGLVNAETSYRAAELARLAQDLAVTSGQNSSETFRRLILNIQQLDTVGLRYQGLVVDRAAAEKELIRTQGLMTSTLTKAQQQQAMYNAVVLEGGKLTGIYELSMQNVGKQIGSLERLHETLSETVGDSLLPAYLAIVEVYGEFLKEVTEGAAAFDANGEAAVTLGVVVRELATLLKDAVLTLLEFKEALIILAALIGTGLVLKATIALGTAVAALGAQFLFTGAAAITMAKQVGVMATAMGVARTAVTLLGFAIRAAFFVGWIIAIIEVLVTLNERFGIIGDSANVAWAAIKLGVQKAIQPLKELYYGLIAVGKAMEALRDGKGTKGAADAFAKEYAKAFKGVLDAKQDFDDSINDFGGLNGKTQDQLIEKGKILVRQLSLYNDSLAEAKVALFELRAQRTDENADVLDEQIKDAEDKVKSIEADVQTAAKGVAAITRNLGEAGRESLRALDTDLRAARGSVATELAKAKVVVIEAEAALYGKESDAGNSRLSKGFQAAAAAFKQLQLPEVTALVSRSTDQIARDFERLGDAAKNPAEIAQALSLVPAELVNTVAAIARTQQDLQDRFATATTAELDAKFQGLTTRLNGLKDAINLGRDAQRGLDADTSNLTQQLLGLGIPLAQAQQGMGAFSGSLANLSTSFKDLASISLDNLSTQFATLSSAYQTDLSNFNRVQGEKRAEITRTASSEAEATRAIKVLDAQSLAGRAELAKKYFSDLRALREQSLQEYVAAKEKVKAIDQQQFDIRTDEAAFRRETYREGLSDAAQYYDRLKELNELAIQSRSADLRGEFEVANDLNRKRVELARSLRGAEGIDPYKSRRDSLRESQKASEDYLRSLDKEKAKAQETADKQEAQYKRLTDALTKLADVLKGIGKEQQVTLTAELETAAVEQQLELLGEQVYVVPIQAELDTEKFKKDIISLKGIVESALAGIRLNGGDTAAPLRRAFGGPVFGAGTSTSDSIPAWLSNNEFVMQAKSVQKYGMGFMKAVNDGTLSLAHLIPAFKSGGMAQTFRQQTLLPGHIPAYRTGGPVSAPKAGQGPSDEVTINLRMGGKKVTLMAERSQARGFVDLLTAVEAQR